MNRIDDATYRAIRGWCLGFQAPMRMRRAMREKGWDCECNYHRPYLHSLSLIDYHWSGPVEANVGDCRRSERHPFCSVTPCRGCIRPHTGGFYSYNPRHIKRMARWEHVHVLGVVSLFGDIAIHEHGYRSDVVRIDHLWVLRSENVRFPHGRLESFLEDTYHCGVTMLKSGAADSFTEWLQKEEIEEIVRLGVREKGE